MTIDKTTLDNLTDMVKDQGNKQQDRTGFTKIIIGVGVSLLAVATIAFLYYRLWKQSKELAKLRHDRDLAIEQVNQAKLKKELRSQEKVIKVIDLATEKAQKEVKNIDEELAKAQTKNNETLKTIDDIRDWNSVDRYLDR